jgi:hypothetical protein
MTQFRPQIQPKPRATSNNNNNNNNYYYYYYYTTAQAAANPAAALNPATKLFTKKIGDEKHSRGSRRRASDIGRYICN